MLTKVIFAAAIAASVQAKHGSKTASQAGVAKVNDTIKKIDQIAHSNQVTPQQRQQAQMALQQVGSVMTLDKKIKGCTSAANLAANVDDIVAQYTAICKMEENGGFLPMLKLPNVTEVILDKIADEQHKSDMVFEQVFHSLGTSIAECEGDDCLNPCHDQGACLRCFSGVLNQGKKLDICSACVL